jgi:hypothetical protein
MAPRILSVLTQTVKGNILKTGGPSPSSLEIWLMRRLHRNMYLFYTVGKAQSSSDPICSAGPFAQLPVRESTAGINGLQTE